MKPAAIAKKYGFPLDVAYGQMTTQQRSRVDQAMTAMGGKSARGARGWYQALLQRHVYVPVEKHVILPRSTILSATVAPLMCTTLEDLGDILG